MPRPTNEPRLQLDKAVSQVESGLGAKLGKGERNTVRRYLSTVGGKRGPTRAQVAMATNLARQKAFTQMDTVARGGQVDNGFYRWNVPGTSIDVNDEGTAGADSMWGKQPNYTQKNGDRVIARGTNLKLLQIDQLSEQLKRQGLLDAHGTWAKTQSEILRNAANYQTAQTASALRPLIKPVASIVAGMANTANQMFNPMYNPANDVDADKVTDIVAGTFASMAPGNMARNLTAEFATVLDQREDAKTRWGAGANLATAFVTSEMGGKATLEAVGLGKSFVLDTMEKVMPGFKDYVMKLYTAAKGKNMTVVQQMLNQAGLKGAKLQEQLDGLKRAAQKAGLSDEEKAALQPVRADYYAGERPIGPSASQGVTGATTHLGEVPVIRKYLGNKVNVIYEGLKKDFMQQGESQILGKAVRTPEELAEHVQLLRDPRMERTFYVFTKDGKVVQTMGKSYRLPGRSPGLTNQDVPEIMRNIQDLGADGFYVVHNHPDGWPLPSKADIDNTAGVLTRIPQYKGHVIVNHNFYGFINSSGLSEGVRPIENARLTLGDEQLPNWLQSRYSVTDPINDYRMISNVINNVNGLGSKPMVTGISGQGEMRVMASIDPSLLTSGNPAAFAGAMSGLARRSGSTRMVLSLPIDSFKSLSKAQLSALSQAIRKGVLGDVLTRHGETLTSFGQFSSDFPKGAFNLEKNAALGRTNHRVLSTSNGKRVH